MIKGKENRDSFVAIIDLMARTHPVGGCMFGSKELLSKVGYLVVCRAMMASLPCCLIVPYCLPACTTEELGFLAPQCAAQCKTKA